MSPVPRCLPHSAEVSRPPSRVTTLMRATQMSENRPFHYRYIDKPAGSYTCRSLNSRRNMTLTMTMAMLFLDPRARWQDADTVRLIPAGGGRELEVSESRFGYRLVKGGHPSLVLVHYTRGPPAPISPGVANLPVRVYPLRTVNEPPTIVIGDKAGQKFYPPGAPGPGMQPPPPPSAHFSLSMYNLNTQQRTIPALASIPDETDQISTSLALTRYKRNHEFMNDVFRQAAFGMFLLPVPPYRHTPVFPRAR
ncbi:hypothetical protein DFP72DRAFT_993186 [Ephemerocybe angulata]|uniref:Uncharacterized protein n=1 Tax=Ephemerocybe angulata TaxID=980116 RepID=A0A8H6HDF3_9AGAR|nr:hypothetical protein DFP72DRAFT_993186 [Tulosesus angulatus]